MWCCASIRRRAFDIPKKVRRWGRGHNVRHQSRGRLPVSEPVVRRRGRIDDWTVRRGASPEGNPVDICNIDPFARFVNRDNPEIVFEISTNPLVDDWIPLPLQPGKPLPERRRVRIDLFYGTPSSRNEKAKERFEQNRFFDTRQLRYSRDETQRALDIGLFINGLPVFTFELKNSLTKQTVDDAVWQYKKDRNPRERLFEFGRCIAHFAVDDSEVRFCTHLQGKASWFLPFSGHCRHARRQYAGRTRRTLRSAPEPDTVVEEAACGERRGGVRLEASGQARTGLMTLMR